MLRNRVGSDEPVGKLTHSLYLCNHTLLLPCDHFEMPDCGKEKQEGTHLLFLVCQC